MTDVTAALVEHYQKTFELTYKLWQQRNRTFLLLLAVIAAATLLSFRTPLGDTLLASWIANSAGLTEETEIAALRKSFPYELLQTILLIVIFYLMVNLYHRAVYVLRNYRYLGSLESEIRDHLKLGENSVSFTRESTFYWDQRSALSGVVKFVYIGILGSLLIVFLFARVVTDFSSENVFLPYIDLAIAIATLLFYGEYARSSVGLDSQAEG